MKPNFLVILIDDLRYDEFGAGGHPYMRTPNVDRLAREGALFERAFHTTPICSPNRASIVTGQYASRHGIIDNVARDAMSHRLPNYHLELSKLGYETAHIGKWHMGNDGMPRPGYDTWVSYDGHGKIVNPTLNHDGRYVEHQGYITDIMNELAVDFLDRKRTKPFSLFFAHKAVHPDATQAADGTFGVSALGGYIAAPRHRDLYRDAMFPKTPNMLPAAEVIRQKPAWAECFGLKESDRARAILEALHAGEQEEIRQRARMMASVDEGIGAILETLERQGKLDDTFIVFLGDNGYFFGEHALGPERRFAYEEGIRSPFVVRYPRKVKAGSRRRELVICQDIAPDADRARRRQAGSADPGALAPAAVRRECQRRAHRKGCRQACRVAQVIPRRVLGRAGDAVARRHDVQGRAHRPLQVHPLGQPWPRGRARRAVRPRSRSVRAQESQQSRAYAPVREKLRRELRKLVAEAIGL